MSVRVEWVVYGRGAVESLRSTIKTAKGGDPLRPVTVVVPSNHVGVATRRLLGSGTLGPIAHRGIGLVAVNFLTPYRVADLLGSARLAGQGRRPVSAPVIGAALRAALGQAPGVFASVATHPATEMALLSAYRELRDLSDGALDNLSRAGTRSLDVVSLHRDARRCLAQDFYDEEDLIEAAIYVLGANPSYSDSFGAVVVYLPQQVSRHGGRLLAALAGQGEMVVLAGTTGDDRADRDVVRCLERMGADRASGDRPIDHDPLSVVGADRSTILTASDSDEEVRAAVRAVIDSARQGKALDRMAILYASANPYARLIHEHLSAAGIRYNGSAVVPLAARMAGRSLLGLLALPEGGYRRDDVFAWLSAARLHYQDKAIPVAAWERVSRQGGVVSGRDQWDRRLSTLADDLEAQARAHAQAAAVDADEPSWRAESLRADASLSRDLREFVLGIIGDLAQVAGDPRPWSAMSKWAGDRVDSLLDPGSGREHWPSAELKAAERLHRALERLACLDAMEATVTLEVFTRTLELELDTDLGRVGRMGQGLLVGPVAMGVGLDLDLVIVLGLAEGLFPSQIQEDSLLPDDDRAQAGAELGLRSWSVERQHRHLLAALAGAKEQLLCVPRGDLRQSLNRMPSRWVLGMAGAIEGESWSSKDLMGARRNWLRHVASYDAGLRQTTFPASEQEHRLISLLAQPGPTLADTVLDMADDPIVESGSHVAVGRRSHRFTRFDGNLAGLNIPSPAAGITSATRLEEWAKCPFAYLVHNVLGVSAFEKPEDQVQITPQNRGLMIHEVLESFIESSLATSPDRRQAPGVAWTVADRQRLVEIVESVSSHYQDRGLTGRSIMWKQSKRQILADLSSFLTADDEYRARNGTYPVATELAFGLGGSALAPVDIDLPDGRQVRFRGKADRVDVDGESVLHVVDYKTGSATGYAGLSSEDPDQGGRRLQLVVYGQAARLHQATPDAPVRADYWFVSARAKFKRIGYLLTPEILDRVATTMGSMVTGIEAGVFPHHPEEGGTTSTTPRVTCPYCDPDSMGVADLRRRFRHKQEDPTMAPFTDLAHMESDTSSGPGKAATGDEARTGDG